MENEASILKKVQFLEEQNKVLKENQVRLGNVMNNYMMLHYLNRNVHEADNSQKLWSAYLHNVTDYGFQYSSAYIFLTDENDMISYKLFLINDELIIENVEENGLDGFILTAKDRKHPMYSDDNTKVAMPMINQYDDLKLILVIEKEYGITLEDTELLMTYGQQTISMVENIMLNERLLQYQALLGEKINDFIMLHHVSQEINNSEDYNNVLKNYLTALSSEIGFNFIKSDLYIIEEDVIQKIELDKKGELVITVQEHLGNEVDEVIKTMEVVVIKEETVLYIPLRSGKKILGVIEVESEKPISNERIKLLEIFARQTAGILYNTKLLYHLKEANERLFISDKMAAIGNFASGIAHELNSPLSGVLTSAQMAKKDLENMTLENFYEMKKELIENLDTIEEGIKKSKNIISKLLSNREKVNLHFDVINKVDVEEIIGLSIATFKEQLKNENIKIETSITKELYLNGNMNNLLPSIKAIIKNSIESFCNLDLKVNRYISIKGYKLREECVIEIEDNGIGMSEEVKLRIFDPFFTTKGVGYGLGLGLTIAYDVFNNFNIKIEIDSTFGKGTKLMLRQFQ